MSKAAEAELRLKFVDKGATSGIDKAAKRIGQTVIQTENLVNQSNTRQRSSYERLSLAREQLGIRSESKIRREIQQTEAAYKRLATSGKLSQDEITRAAEKTRLKVTQLTNEMGKLTKEQQAAARAAKQFETVQSRIRTGVAAGAGVAAAGYALKAPVMTAISYDQQLALTANTAFPELDATGRGAKVGSIERIINDAVRKYGGQRESALGTYNTLLSSGEFSNQETQDLLGLTLKGQTASGADSQALAAIMLAAKRSGVTTSQMPAALSKAIKAGQLGGFELTDLARYLPVLLSSANSLGVTGMSGFERVLVSAQGAVTTAGTKDEAANNLINIFEKINAESTATLFDKQGVDLRKELAKRVDKGQDTISAFTGLIDEIIAKNPEAKAAAKRVDELSAGTGRNDPNRQQNLEAIQKIVESSVLGRFLVDRQALQGFRGEQFSNRSGLFGRVGGGVSTDSGQELQTSFDVAANRPGFAVAQAQEEAAIAQKAAMDKLIPTITKAAEMFVDLSQKYPDLSAAVIGATPPIIAMGTAAGISALAMGGKFPAMSPTGKVIKGGATAGLFGAGAIVGDMALDAVTDKDSAINRYGKSALNGAAVGATVGSVFPIVGTGIGAAAGSGIGLLYEGVGDMLRHDAKQTAKVDAHLTVDAAPGFVIKRKEAGTMSTTINQRNDTGNFHTGAPGSPR